MKETTTAAAWAFALIVAAIGMSGLFTKPTAVSHQRETLSIETVSPAVVTIDEPGLSQPEVPPSQAEPDATAEVAVDASAVVFKQPAYVPQTPAGHYERRGLFGRQSVWVKNQPQLQSRPANQTYGGRTCAGGRCR